MRVETLRGSALRPRGCCWTPLTPASDDLVPRGSVGTGGLEVRMGGEGAGVGTLEAVGATAEEEGAGSLTVGTLPPGELCDVETVSAESATPRGVGVLGGGVGAFMAPLMRDMRSSNCETSGTLYAPF